MVYSKKCQNLTTRWDGNISRCVPCIIKPGHETTPNCGYDDYGGRREVPYRKCRHRTFNDGSGPTCLPCTACLPGHTTVAICSSVADTQCRGPGSHWNEDNETVSAVTTTHGPTTSQPGLPRRRITDTVPVEECQSLISQPPPSQDMAVPAAQWAVPLVIIISISLVLLAAWTFHRKRNRGRQPVLSFRRRSSLFNGGLSSLSAPHCHNPLEGLLSPDLLAAPLQSVLDDLDVLEELVILLDPESQVAKNTKHLASHCSFPATWITYTYSMRDSKSPLKAVLEGLASRQPDWTVGHLARLLRKMERNDAIAVLSRLGHREGGACIWPLQA